MFLLQYRMENLEEAQRVLIYLVDTLLVGTKAPWMVHRCSPLSQSNDPMPLTQHRLVDVYNLLGLQQSWQAECRSRSNQVD